MMTLSGRLLTMEDGLPTLHDIAVGLSRIPRFAGQTRIPYSVAQHSLCVAAMASVGRQSRLDQMVLHALFHDAHEMMTEDIPTSFKTLEVKKLQRDLDRRIYGGFGLPMPSPIQQEVVKLLDRDALLAEAKVLTPQATYDRIKEETGHRADLIFEHHVVWYSSMTQEDAYAEFKREATLLIDRWGR